MVRTTLRKTTRMAPLVSYIWLIYLGFLLPFANGGTSPNWKKWCFWGERFFSIFTYFTPKYFLRRLQAPQAWFKHSRAPMEAQKAPQAKNLVIFGVNGPNYHKNMSKTGENSWFFSPPPNFFFVFLWGISPPIFFRGAFGGESPQIFLSPPNLGGKKT